jgi:hypothetical protein
MDQAILHGKPFGIPSLLNSKTEEKLKANRQLAIPKLMRGLGTSVKKCPN